MSSGVVNRFARSQPTSPSEGSDEDQRREVGDERPSRFLVNIEEGPHQGSSHRSLIIISLIFVMSLCCLVVLYYAFPQLDKREKELIKIPTSIKDAKEIGKILVKYKNSHFLQVFFGFSLTYIFLQTFAIPGSLFLSLLAGFLFPLWLALLLVCFCSAVGASLCYYISLWVGRSLVIKYFPAQVNEWALTVENHRDNLVNYVIFLRLTPLIPNWFINVVSPIIGVPIGPFFVGTFIGLMPPSFMCVHAGTALNQLTSTSDAITWSSIAMLFFFIFISLIPILIKG